MSLEKKFSGCVYPQFLRLKENEESLESFYRYWNEQLGGKLIIKKYDWFCGKLESKKTADLEPVNRNPCWHLRRDFVILFNGDVPLCQEEILGSSQGNVFTEDLQTIWQRRNELVEEHLQGKYNSMCEKCDEYYIFNF